MRQIARFVVMSMVAVVASATLRAAVVESTDPDTGYKVLTVAAGEFAEYATVLDASVTGLIKRGTGTAWLTGANSAFVGPIQIEAGVLGGSNGAFGKTGNLTVSNGATLDVTKQANSAMNTRKVFFEGVGLGGIGAIICTNASGYSNRDAMFKNVEMTGDATWASGARHGMSSGTFTMNGYTLTKIGSGTLSLFQSISQPGHFMLNKGELLAQSGAKLNGDASNTITANGGYVNMWCLNYSTELINWTYVTKGSASLYAGGLHANRTGYNQYAGPISIEGSQLTIYMNNTDRKLSLTGPITTGPGGTGKLIKSGSGDGGDTWIMNDAQLGSVTVSAGDLHFVDANVTVSNAYSYVSRATSGRVPRLTLTNTTWIAHPQASGKYGKERNSNQILVGNSANSWGLMKIYNDTTITNDISVGYDSALGAIHQSGSRSKVYTRATTSNDGYIGYGTKGGYGYWGLSDGTVEVYAHTTVGLHTNSVGFITIRGGGLFKMLNSSWKFSKGGHAELYVEDGTFDAGSTFTFGSQDYSDTTGGVAVITADGTNALIKLGGTTYFQWRTNFWSQLNVRNGGTVQLKTLTARSGVGLAQEGLSESFVSFDGGTIRLTSDAVNVFGNATTHTYDPTAVTVFAGGATIETEAANAIWSPPLVRPTGKSILSVTLPTEVLTSTNALGPMRITISGAGHGATAIADYEDATYRTKGVIVTSPGYGYDDETTTVTIDRWDRKAKIPCTCTLGEVASGGFTKKGGGKLTLGGANTYAGATRLEGGTLAFADPNGYPGGDLEIPAAAVQGALAAPLLTANTLAFAEGKGVRVTEADTLDEATFGAMKTVAKFTNPIALPSLTLVNADGTARTGNRQWCLMLADGGRTLKFGPLRGTQILLR